MPHHLLSVPLRQQFGFLLLSRLCDCMYIPGLSLMRKFFEGLETL